MPAMLRIDTLKFARSLSEAGMDRRQAEALVQGLSDADTSDFATKPDIADLRADVADLRAELKGEIAELRTELKGEIAELRAELKGEIAELRTELKGGTAELRTGLNSGIAELRTEFTGEIGALRTELRTGLAAARSETFRFMYLQVIAIVGLTVTLVKLLP